MHICKEHNTDRSITPKLLSHLQMKGEISLKELIVNRKEKKKKLHSLQVALFAWGNERPNSYRHQFLKF